MNLSQSCSYENESSAAVNLSTETVRDEDNSIDHPIDILAPSKYEIDPKCILEMSKANNTFHKVDVKENCKILTFSSDWSFDEVLSTIASLNPADYPHLFAFTIKIKQFGPVDDTAEKKALELKLNLLEFSRTRPLIAQVSSEEDNRTKIFYNDKNSDEFQQVDQTQKSYENVKDFPSLLSFLMKKGHDGIENILLDHLQHLQHLSLILRYLRACKLSNELIGSLVLECAENGSLNCFLSSLDASFESHSLNVDAQSLLSSVFENDESENEPESSQNDKVSVSSVEFEESSLNKVHLEAANDHLSRSVLLAAIESKNQEVVEFLINSCSHLIQELPFKHQVGVSTTAFNSNQLDVLCNLLKTSDFPFPYKFNINDPIVNTRLLNIANSRLHFGLNIKAENFKEISKFIDRNSNLKHIYNLSNESAMKHAINFKKYNVYFHLQALGLKASEFHDLEKVLTADELKTANKFAFEQRRQHVEQSLFDENNSVNLLCTRSFIHNRKITKEKEKEYRQKIRQWYKDILKIRFGPEFLNAVSLCEQIKIIFDFDSDNVRKIKIYYWTTLDVKMAKNVGSGACF